MPHVSLERLLTNKHKNTQNIDDIIEENPCFLLILFGIL